MDTVQIKEIFLSQQAVILYESAVALALAAAVAVLSWRRKKRKKQEETSHIRQEEERLDNALVNRKRRNEG